MKNILAVAKFIRECRYQIADSEYPMGILTNLEIARIAGRAYFRMQAILKREGLPSTPKALSRDYQIEYWETAEVIIGQELDHTITNKLLQIAQVKHQNRAARHSPPKLGEYALLLIPKRNRENLIGDLEEEYRTVILPKYGPRLAAIWYWVQAVWVIGPFIWAGVKRATGLEIIWKLIGR
jgi:hypothetical protein